MSWVRDDLYLLRRIYPDGKRVGDESVVLKDDSFQGVVNSLCDVVSIAFRGRILVKPDNARVKSRNYEGAGIAFASRFA